MPKAKFMREHYAECPHRFTEDGKEAPGAKPKAPSATEEQVKELLLENPQQSNAQIRDAVGLSPNQHRVVERERGRLETEGAIPVVTAREGSDGTVRHVPQATHPVTARARRRPAKPSDRQRKPGPRAHGRRSWVASAGWLPPGATGRPTLRQSWKSLSRSAAR